MSEIQVKIKILRYEFKVARVWAQELYETGLLRSTRELHQINSIVESIEKLNSNSLFDFVGKKLIYESDDVHMCVKDYLILKKCVNFGNLYFTGRSRNDTSVTVSRLWLSNESQEVLVGLHQICSALLDRAEELIEVPFVSFTHERPLDITRFSQYLISYFLKLLRAYRRIANGCNFLSYCPLGVGGISGTTINIDRDRVSKRLGFDEASINSVDMVSDRGFISEFSYYLLELQMELSTIVHDVLIWSRAPCPMIIPPESTVSTSATSANRLVPTALFRVRANFGLVKGEFDKLILMRKGVMTGYSADYCEDKSCVLNILEILRESKDTILDLIKGMNVDMKAISQFSHMSKMELGFIEDDEGDFYKNVRSYWEEKNNTGGDSFHEISTSLKNCRNILRRTSESKGNGFDF